MKNFILILCLVLSSYLYSNDENFAYVIKIDGGINPASNDYIESALNKALKNNVKFLLIELNTPGGLLNSTRKIVQTIIKSEVPTVVYITPSGAQAGSAGVMITMAANIAAMAPATNIGAAHPVSSSGKDIGKSMSEKIENDTIAFVKSIAEHRKRNVNWAELSVKKSSSLTSKEALEKNVIDLIASDRNDLLKKLNNLQIKNVGSQNKTVLLNTENIVLKSIEMNLMQKIIMQLSEPNIAYILMMAGMLGLYVEFTNPGLIFPGVAGAVCLVLSFISFQTLPINIGAFALIILGIIFLIAEIFVTSFGVLSVGGIVSLFIGSVFLIDSSVTDATISYSVIIPTILSISALIISMGFLILKARWKPKATGADAMIGKIAEVKQSSPNAKVFLDGCLWSAETSDNSDILEGTKVKVIKIEGLRLIVKNDY